MKRLDVSRLLRCNLYLSIPFRTTLVVLTETRPLPNGRLQTATEGRCDTETLCIRGWDGRFMCGSKGLPGPRKCGMGVRKRKRDGNGPLQKVVEESTVDGQGGAFKSSRSQSRSHS